MEVRFTPELEAKVTELAGRSGVPVDELVLDVVAGYVDGIGELRTTLDRRYDDVETGRVQLVDGEEVRREMKAKTQAERDRHA